ncbi:MAG: hypothetical protein AABX47_01530 [Nanoarchaeota archaeon]
MKIAIDGKSLHDIKMKLKSSNTSTTPLISYPENRIKASVNKEIVTLMLPPLLALELFRLGVLQSKELRYISQTPGKGFGILPLRGFKTSRSVI